MKTNINPSNGSSFFQEQFAAFRQILRTTIISIPVSIVIGSLVAFFLWLLSLAIHFRFDHKWLLFLLPLAGLIIHFIYRTVGKSSEKGNNLIIEQIALEGGEIPPLMGPVILVTTVITHLFGGSAGREGTAVQIGGSIAALFGRWFKLKGSDLKIVLIAGIAAGFGAVFGTPVTGAIFAMEVLAIGKIQYNALIPGLIAALVGDLTVSAWHITHVQYHIDAIPAAPYFLSDYLPIDFLLLAKVFISSTAFGLASLLFSEMAHKIKALGLKLFKHQWMLPILGGLIIIGLTLLLGKPDYLSLGVDAEYPGAVTIPSAFHTGGAQAWSWFWKTLYTTITLATGFKGGEVTPLFYIGATLGNTLATVLNAPVSLFAALGFIAVFAGATKTPLACTFMGVELFGGEHVLLFTVACFTAYFFSGNSGIYTAHRTAIPKKVDPNFVADSPLSETMNPSGYFYQKLNKYSAPFKKQFSRIRKPTNS
ncbi:chloride channel protein [Pedobacter duraquae]|uniref:H+/Cl-antiporter ClcA n=1 Tax=Pedobacter duraquae TaxID=425511 RepID=A0A4R6ILE3_9SPHI|nr:chloride channel protein [Pedobacter duraquae]TDO22950.1 H+/Cl- antiporter ClcA [Pedobacter duraquae]